MRVRSINFSFFLLLQALAVSAWPANGQFEPLENIQKTAVAALWANNSEIALHPRENVEITAANLDRRLQMPRCDKALTADSAFQQRSPRPMIKVSCEGSRHWSIHVPVTVTIDTPIAVASQALKRGQILQDGDFEFRMERLSGRDRGYIQSAKALIGKELKRSASAGQAIRAQNISEPLAIKRGDQVVVEASAGALLVVTTGIAMASGHIGEQIKIKNTDSERIISARVVNESTVRVIM